MNVDEFGNTLACVQDLYSCSLRRCELLHLYVGVAAALCGHANVQVPTMTVAKGVSSNMATENAAAAVVVVVVCVTTTCSYTPARRVDPE